MATRRILLALVAGAAQFAYSEAQTVGRIVLASDERMLSDAGFVPPNNPDQLALNVADWFTGGASGSFLVWSNHPGLTGSQLALAMVSAGHDWTATTAGTFHLGTLLNYDGVFVGGLAADTAVLTEYVNAGGNVYVMAGSGAFADAAEEASAWNPFVQSFGLSLSPVSNGLFGDIAVGDPHPVTAGVNSLAYDDGQSIFELDPNNPNPDTQTLISQPGESLLAVCEFTNNRPPDDSCAAAQPIGNGTTAFSTIGATTDGPLEDHPCQQTGSDIWFLYASPCPGTVFIDLCDSNFDTQVFVYAACPTEPGQALACNDDSCGQQSLVDFFAQGGQTYLIRIGGFEGAQGTGNVTISHTGTQLTGDVNGDGVVDLADLATLLSHFGLGPVPPQTREDGDLDGDGDVDLSDLALLLSDFGTSCV
ncbi:MAG: hypothetical protein HZB38_18615 [Planctomycetes bacterium]|nr:hypothetical protein [Planctomycetota bacterium]